MARIEARSGIQLSLPEHTTVIVIPQSGAVRRQGDVEQKVTSVPTVDAKVILTVIQAFKDNGEEGINSDSLEQQLQKAKARGFTFDQFATQIDTIIAETRSKQEGKTIGTLPAAMNDVRKLILNLAEEVWTTPS